MTELIVAPVLCGALEKFKEVVRAHSEKHGAEGKPLIVFCEDRLSLVAERAVCEAVGGTFAVSVYTLSRFLSAEGGRCENVLSSQGSAMAISKLIEKNRESLQLFKGLSSATAAQDVYDTIALLYSSKISPDDLNAAHAPNRLLQRKIHDLQLLYGQYSQYLKDSGAVDRNTYLRRLPDVIRSSRKIKGADVVIFGFQAFTSSLSDSVRALLQTAENVYGIFIGGNEKKYVNEGWTTFLRLAGECGKAPSTIERTPSPLIPAAEQLRKYVFEPECFHTAQSLPLPRGALTLVKAADEDGECEFIAASILKTVREEGLRYRDISVMTADINGFQPVLERVFGEYGIPFYVDRTYPLASHSACDFIINFLVCAADGCRRDSVISVVTSPLFAFPSENEEEDKDVFVNYMLRLSSGRGGVKRAVNADMCALSGFDPAVVERVRSAFVQAVKLLPAREAEGEKYCAAIRELLDGFGAKARLEEMAGQAEEYGFSSVGEMSARALSEILKVVNEAERLTSGDKYSPREFIKILRSGFTAAEVSLIPPKQDAVFVGDLSACANTGSKVLFVRGLTDSVPACSPDTAILTDGEIACLEKLQLAISPKIAQVNKRVREVTALNLCAFSKELYLTYPVSCGGEDVGESEVMRYAKRLFSVDGKSVECLSSGDIMGSEDYFAYSFCRQAPAVRRIAAYLGGSENYDEKRIAAACKHLAESYGEGALSSLEKAGGATVKDVAPSLYGKSVSPTTLETYYSCPYMAFAARGLRLEERREETFRPLDSGNFIHTVLEETARVMNGFENKQQCVDYARGVAEKLSASPQYSPMEGDGGAEYSSHALIEEAAAISAGMFEQLKNSDFFVESVERTCNVELDGATVGGRIDRVDSCGDMVRIIDYKTGSIDDKPESYYMGLKLQLPLYLTAVAEGRRPVGAYYFPANLEYSSEDKGVFTLKGFMDGSEDVIRRSDVTLEDKQRSKYVGATLNGGKKTDKAMDRQDFADFIAYSLELAGRGFSELLGGEIAPSPVDEACTHCKFKGLCAYDGDKDGVRERQKADCKTIAAIMRGEDIQ